MPPPITTIPQDNSQTWPLPIPNTGPTKPDISIENIPPAVIIVAAVRTVEQIKSIAERWRIRQKKKGKCCKDVEDHDHHHYWEVLVTVESPRRIIPKPCWRRHIQVNCWIPGKTGQFVFRVPYGVCHTVSSKHGAGTTFPFPGW